MYKILCIYDNMMRLLIYYFYKYTVKDSIQNVMNNDNHPKIYNE